jgi:hypothetical protein
VVYNLVGDSLALQYFIMNQQTGEIYQRRGILYDPAKTTEYTVSTCYSVSIVYSLFIHLQLIVTAEDQGTPTSCMASRNATIRVRVNRNLFAPSFGDSSQYVVSINEDLGVGSRLTSVRAIDDDQRVSGQS